MYHRRAEDRHPITAGLWPLVQDRINARRKKRAAQRREGLGFYGCMFFALVGIVLAVAFSGPDHQPAYTIKQAISAAVRG